jgi:hypothetical protein
MRGCPHGFLDKLLLSHINCNYIPLSLQRPQMTPRTFQDQSLVPSVMNNLKTDGHSANHHASAVILGIGSYVFTSEQNCTYSSPYRTRRKCPDIQLGSPRHAYATVVRLYEISLAVGTTPRARKVRCLFANALYFNTTTSNTQQATSPHCHCNTLLHSYILTCFT